MATYKALQYAFSIWSPLSSSTSINKLQIMQHAALGTDTGNTTQTSAWRNTHTSHTLAPTAQHITIQTENTTSITSFTQQYFNTPRLNIAIFNIGRYTTNLPTDHHTVTTTDIETNMRHIHTSIFRHLATRGNNKILRTPPVNHTSLKRYCPASLVAPMPNLEQRNPPFLSHTYTKSSPNHIHHHYALPPL